MIHFDPDHPHDPACCFVATTTAAIIAAATAAGASTAAGAMQAHAAGNAAEQQTVAANHAADVQGKSAAEALAFQKQQAEGNWQNDEVNRKANYDQWAAHEGNVGTIGQYLGLGGKTISPYVPSVDPRYTDPTPGPAPTAMINGRMVPIPVGSGQTPAAAADIPGTVGGMLTRPPVNPYYPPGTVGAYLNGAR